MTQSPETFTQSPTPKAPPSNWQDYFELPPVGTATEDDHPHFARVREYIAVESRNERSKWIDIRNASICIFNYGAYPQPADDDFIVNFAQGDLIGIKAAMFAEPVAIEIGIEDDGSGVLAYYWNGPDTVQAPAMQQSIDPRTGAMVQQPAMGPTGQPVMQQVSSAQMYGLPPSAPDPVTGEMVAQPIDEQTAIGLLQSGIPEHWIVACTNKTISDVYQLSHDSYWRKCYADEWVDQFVMGTLKGGWNTGLIQMDEDGFQLFNIPVVNCFPDPTRQFVWDWDNGEIHWVLRLQKAQQLYPQYAKLLFDNSQRGNPKLVDSQSEMGYQYDRDFQTRTVTLSVTWMKNQPIPMTVEEAVNGGHVQENSDPNGTGGSQQAIPEQGTVGGSEIPQPDFESSIQGAGQSDIGTYGSVNGGASVPSYNLPDGTPVTPYVDGKPLDLNWPMRYTMRQFAMLDTVVIDDDECPWPAMPIMHATAIPFEDSPFGFSPLWKMRHSQRADSQMAEAISANCAYLGNPASWMDQGLKDIMEEKLKTAFIRPGDSLGLLPDMIGPNGVPKVGFIPLPPMNEHHIEGRQQNQNDRKELGGYTDAIKGTPVTSNASGTLQQETMAAASGVISSISKHLQGSIKHMACLMLHGIVHYMTVDQVYYCCKRYRKDVLAAIHTVHAKTACWKVEAILASGAGQHRQQRRQELMALNAQIDPATTGTGMPVVDAETLQEMYNLDPETIRQRNQRALQAKMQMMPSPQEDPNAESTDKPDHGANGNGFGRMSANNG